MKLSIRKQFLIYIISISFFNLNKAKSGDYAAGLVLNFSGIFDEQSRATSFLLAKNSQLAKKSVKDQFRSESPFLGYTGFFDRSGLGMYASYTLNYDFICFKFNMGLIYNFVHKMILYKVDSDSKGYGKFYKEEKDNYLKILKNKNNPNRSRYSKGFDKYFNEDLPVSFLKFHSIYLPLSIQPIFKITKSIHYSPSIFLKIKYFISVFEGPKNDNIKLNVSKYYNNLYLDIGLKLLNFDIYFFEEFIDIDFCLFYVSFSILDLLGGESLYDSENLKKYNKIKNAKRYKSLEMINGKFNHHKIHQYGSEINIRFNILSLFVFPEKKKPFTKLKKAKPIGFS
ncbi:MAG: hypothetical protein GY830_00660 [Bacteroidetes bacterium]|nr:hypothetical protein [Bacteroidota bacterium]